MDGEFRCAVTFVLAASAFFFYKAVKGIRTGKIMWRDDESRRFDRMVFRDEEPFFFWFTVIIHLGFGIFFLALIIHAIARRVTLSVP